MIVLWSDKLVEDFLNKKVILLNFYSQSPKKKSSEFEIRYFQSRICSKSDITGEKRRRERSKDE